MGIYPEKTKSYWNIHVYFDAFDKSKLWNHLKDLWTDKLIQNTAKTIYTMKYYLVIKVIVKWKKAKNKERQTSLIFSQCETRI